MQTCRADRIQQHEAQPPARDFLVHAEERVHAFAPEPRRIDRQAGAGQQAAHAADLARGQPAAALREFGGKHDAGGDRLAVQPAAVAQPGFDRVPEAVPEVQQCAWARFALVAGDDSRP